MFKNPEKAFMITWGCVWGLVTGIPVFPVIGYGIAKAHEAEEKEWRKEQEEIKQQFMNNHGLYPLY